MDKKSADTLMRKVGVAVLTGTLVLAQVPAQAIAEEAGASSSAQQTSGSQPPEIPSGDSSSGGPGQGSGDGQPGEPPSGEAPDGAPGGEGGGPGQGGAPGMGGADTMTFDYTGTYSGAVTADGESVSQASATYSATEADVNAALVQNGGALALTGVSLTKSGDDTNGDNCNFYGLNSILLAVGEGSAATIEGSGLSATSEGSNGIFATDNATVLAKDVTISTTAGNSRGLDATYGGTILAGDVTITTQGDHCAGVATDRGGGNISVDGGKISTAGSGSPILYSTGDVEVQDITGTATGSQIAGMEGLNTILIKNSTLESTITSKTASDPVANGVIIYQSTSGDAESATGSTATFQAVDSTLKSAIESGSMFYLTNTSADVVLSNTKLDFDSSKASLVYAAGNDSNSWGTAGSNGASVKLTGIKQELAGAVVADTISSIDLYLTDGTIWTGSARIEENSAGSTSESPITVNIDATSSWVVNGDSTVSNLNAAEGAKIVDSDGKAVTIVAGGQTVVQGDSAYAITVTGSYSTSCDASAAGTVSESAIDRSAYNEAFGIDESGEGTSAEGSADAGGSWLDAIVNWFKGLFGF